MPPPSDAGSNERKTYHRGRKLRQGTTALFVGVGAVWTILRWKPYRVEISGPSMAPALLPGDFALAVKPGRLRKGNVVVIEHPERPGLEMVKRITCPPGELAPDGRILGPDEWWVEGDDPARSTDSRHFGPVAGELIKAKVRLVYWSPARRRIL